MPAPGIMLHPARPGEDLLEFFLSDRFNLTMMVEDDGS